MENFYIFQQKLDTLALELIRNGEFLESRDVEEDGEVIAVEETYSVKGVEVSIVSSVDGNTFYNIETL